MKSSLMRLFFCLVLSLLILHDVIPQEQVVPVQRSRNKVLLNGKVYYLHSVQKGETLYTLCRVYNISDAELRKENPGLEEGLKEGMVLKIPERAPLQEKPLPGDTSVYVFHIVNKGETLFSLAKFYGITIDQIAEYNPEVKYSAIQVNQVLKIPKSILRSASRIIEKGEGVSGRQIDSSRYIVGQGETLYSLSRRWNTTPSEIILANGGAVWRGLKAGDTILIPLPKRNFPPAPVVKGTIVPTVSTDTIQIIRESQFYHLPDTCTCDSYFLPLYTGPVSLYLLLPFNIDRGIAEINDTLLSRLSDPSFAFRSASETLLKNGWYEYYLGFLLGTQQMRNKGYSLKITAGDFGNAPVITGPMLSRIESAKPDVIISPVSDNRMNVLETFCSQQNIPLITPVFPTNYNDSLPYRFLSFEPSQQILISSWAQWFKRQNDSLLIVIHSADSASMKTIMQLRNLLPEKRIVEAVQNDTTLANVEPYLVKVDTNVVLVLSDREEYAGEVLRNLILLARTYTFMVLGSPSWNNFPSIDAAYFHQLNLHYFTPYLIDYRKPDTKEFLDRFRNVFGFYPVKMNSRGMHYAMMGYDMACMIIPQTFRYGKSLRECFNPNLKGLQGDYHFIRSSSCSGYTKHSLYLVTYGKDYSVSSVLWE
ncbi:MAG: PBP1 and LysM peptidoglycan-binding domain-containing protein [Bacteroidales bacterium]